jgi:response regulator of citrate/malate metabolism
MSEGLSVMVLDNDPAVSHVLKEMIEQFYSWGNVVAFSRAEAAMDWCFKQDVGLGIFVVDVFLKGMSGFLFLDSIEHKFPSAHQDAILISSKASEDVVDMCLASRVNYLLDKPVQPYALQFAVRAITAKYLDYAKRLMHHPAVAKSVSRLHPVQPNLRHIPFRI